MFMSKGRPDLFTRKPAMLQETALARPFTKIDRFVRTVFSIPNAARQPEPVNIRLFKVPVDQLIRDLALPELTTNSNRSLPFACSGYNKSLRKPIVTDEVFLNQRFNCGLDRIRVEIARDELGT